MTEITRCWDLGQVRDIAELMPSEHILHILALYQLSPFSEPRPGNCAF